MLTKRRNMLETIRGKPDRFVNQFEALSSYSEPVYEAEYGAGSPQ